MNVKPSTSAPGTDAPPISRAPYDPVAGESEQVSVKSIKPSPNTLYKDSSNHRSLIGATISPFSTQKHA